MKAPLCDPCLANDGTLTPASRRFGYRGTGVTVHLCGPHAAQIKAAKPTPDDAARIVSNAAAAFASLQTGRPVVAVPVLPAEPAPPGVGFGGFELRGLRQAQGDETRRFSADVWYNGRKVGTTGNAGTGGCDDLHFTDPAAETAYSALAKERHPGERYEVVDLLTEDMISASERKRWAAKLAAQGYPVAYEFVKKVSYWGGETASDSAYRTTVGADVDLAKGDFVRAHRILADGTLGPAVAGKVKPETKPGEPVLTNGGA